MLSRAVKQMIRDMESETVTEQYNWQALLNDSINTARNKRDQMNNKNLSMEDKVYMMRRVRSELMFAVECTGHILKGWDGIGEG